MSEASITRRGLFLIIGMVMALMMALSPMVTSSADAAQWCSHQNYVYADGERWKFLYHYNANGWHKHVHGDGEGHRHVANCYTVGIG